MELIVQSIQVLELIVQASKLCRFIHIFQMNDSKVASFECRLESFSLHQGCLDHGPAWYFDNSEDEPDWKNWGSVRPLPGRCMTHYEDVRFMEIHGVEMPKEQPPGAPACRLVGCDYL